MESIKSWAFSVCCAAVIGTLLNMILPEGNLQRMFKCVFCVFFLCTVLTPLSKIEISDFFDKKNEITDFNFEETDGINQSTEKFLENKILSSVSETLSFEGISYEDIFIKINISDDGSIDINKFKLTIKNPEEEQKAFKLICDRVGVEPEIIFSGENKNE